MQRENGNKIRCHSKLDLESSTYVVTQAKQQRQAWKTLNQVQGDDLVCYNYNNAFTLIELLVVVLIIGILAAVAVPQYQKAVYKSRYVQAKTMAKSIADAEEVYYMANGKYTTDFEELSIDLPAVSFNTQVHYANFSWGFCELVSNGGRSDVECSINKNGAAYLMYFLGYAHSNYFPNKANCIAFGTSGKPSSTDVNSQICAADTKDPYKGSWGTYSDYWEY